LLQFERDLALKQAQYGPEHPLVADCLSNMAIIYNQRGEQDMALSMYQRALRIFEQVQRTQQSGCCTHSNGHGWVNNLEV